MVEITEVLRLWRDGVSKKRSPRVWGSIRRRFPYITVPQGTSLRVCGAPLSEPRLRDALLA